MCDRHHRGLVVLVVFMLACALLAACSGSATTTAADGDLDASADAGVGPDGPVLPVDAAPVDASGPDAACVPCPECPWELETVDTGAGEFGSLARGPDNTLHVTYEEMGTGRLKHAARAPGGGGWTFEVVDPGSSRYSSLAVGPDGTLHVAYQWQMPGRLRYARLGPGDEFWELTTVVEGGETGRYPSLGVTPDGTVHIAYFDETNLDVDYAHLPAGSVWSTEIVASTGFTGLYPTLTTRPDGVVDIASFEPTPSHLNLAEGTAGSWALSVADPAVNIAPYPKLAYGPDMTLYAAYIDTGFIDAVLRFATRPPGGVWSWVTVLDCCDSGWHVSIAIDSDSGVHLAYYHGVDDDLKYAYRAAGDTTFTVTTVDTGSGVAGNVGEYSSLVYAPNHSVHITYFDRTNGALKHAMRPGRCQ